jgi:antitoxin VapB
VSIMASVSPVRRLAQRPGFTNSHANMQESNMRGYQQNLGRFHPMNQPLADHRLRPIGYEVPSLWYHVPMAFNVKDDEVIRLADELAKRLHLPSRIDAIRHALKAQIEVTQSRTENRADELLDVLSAEIWPLLTDRSPITKSERERALGYDSATGV